MSWVVDTCVVIDILDDDPEFGGASAALLDKMHVDGLVLCPVSYIELAPAFLGDGARQREFLDQVGIDYSAAWAWPDTQAAHPAWQKPATRKSPGSARPNRPLCSRECGRPRRGCFRRRARIGWRRRRHPRLPPIARRRRGRRAA